MAKNFKNNFKSRIYGQFSSLQITHLDYIYECNSVFRYIIVSVLPRSY